MEKENLNSLDWWKAALAGNAPPFDPEKPARGWYRARRKNEDYKPYAYWYDAATGELQCLCAGEEIDEERARKLWLWVHKNPITYKTYESVVAGNPWPDVDETVAAQRLVSHNDTKIDPVDAYTRKIEEAGLGVGKYSEVTSDEQAAQAQTLRDHLLKLRKEADEKREEVKKPYWTEIKDIDGKWMPVIKKAKEYADKIKLALAAYETKKLKTPPGPDEEAPAKTIIKGATGRAASVRKKRVATAITNLDVFILSVKDRPELEPLLLTLAQKILDENNDVLGCAIDIVAEIR
jgi:hypothetical protein